MLNKTIVQGRLTRDPEISYFSDFPRASFTVAWSEKYKDTETKLFLPCTAWRGTAQMLEKFFKKGQEIIVEGRLTTDTWTDTEGNEKSRLVMQVEKVNFCGTKSSNSSDQSLPSPEEDPDGFKNIPDGIAEELPFV